MAQMNWEEAEILRQGSVIATVNRALLGNGNVFHSVRIGRQDVETDIKPTQYLRPTDMDDLEALCKEVRYWCQADIDEIRKQGAPTRKSQKPQKRVAPQTSDELTPARADSGEKPAE